MVPQIKFDVSNMVLKGRGWIRKHFHFQGSPVLWDTLMSPTWRLGFLLPQTVLLSCAGAVSQDRKKLMKDEAQLEAAILVGLSDLNKAL